MTNVSEEALLSVYEEAFYTNVSPGMGYTTRHLNALRAAIASSRAAVDVPDWVTHVEIEFQGPDPAWPNGTRWQEGMGTTVAEAIADASKDGGQ